MSTGVASRGEGLAPTSGATTTEAAAGASVVLLTGPRVIPLSVTLLVQPGRRP
jgi:hypothetical protein